MREFKFRVWNTRLKEIHYPSFFKFGRRYEFDWGGICHSWDRNETIVMQYTGIQDKNGKDIYEGDLVKYIYQDFGVGIYRIIWYHGCFCLEAHSGDCTCGILPLKGILSATIEIVGNIYQNSPEVKESTLFENDEYIIKQIYK